MFYVYYASCSLSKSEANGPPYMYLPVYIGGIALGLEIQSEGLGYPTYLIISQQNWLDL